jgi:hypothetical protein
MESKIPNRSIPPAQAPLVGHCPSGSADTKECLKELEQMDMKLAGLVIEKRQLLEARLNQHSKEQIAVDESHEVNDQILRSTVHPVEGHNCHTDSGGIPSKRGEVTQSMLGVEHSRTGRTIELRYVLFKQKPGLHATV